MLPLISCVCPTTASRNHFLPVLLRSFLLQTYPNKELVVVSEDDIPLPDHPLIRLVKCEPGLTLGAKRNVCCAASRGEIIAHFDSDDYSAPGRLAQMHALMQKSKKPVVGYSCITFYDPLIHSAYHSFPGPRGWSCGTALVFTKAFWQRCQFQDRQTGEDAEFIKQATPRNVEVIDGRDMLIASNHPDNTWLRTGHRGITCSADKAAEAMFADKPKKIALALLTWNTCGISYDGIQALLAEKTRLQAAGFDAEVIVLDNGSNDGAERYLRMIRGITLIRNSENRGSATARNQIIDKALSNGADHVLFCDGDIEIVPWSVLQMALWLEQNPNAGCIGVWSEDFKDQRALTTPHLVTPINGQPSHIIAWTQYGLFNRACLTACRFDENFKAGWGCEDNDFGWQMIHNAHMMPHHFRGMTYLHRHAHSSVTNLRNAGQDTHAVYLERKAYCIQKWSHIPSIVKLLASINYSPKPEPLVKVREAPVPCKCSCLECKAGCCDDCTDAHCKDPFCRGCVLFA